MSFNGTWNQVCNLVNEDPDIGVYTLDTKIREAGKEEEALLFLGGCGDLTQRLVNLYLRKESELHSCP